MVYRFYQVFIVVQFVLGFLFDIFAVLVFEVAIPVAEQTIILVAAFTNFMGGLLVAEIRVEFSILFPVAVFLGAWTFWWFYPVFGCFYENIFIPFAQIVLPLALQLLSFGLTIVNLFIRVFNSLVPLIGFIINIIVEFFVVFFSTMVSLVGDGEIFRILDAVISAVSMVAGIVLGFIEAVISVAPTVLSVLTQVIGLCITIIIEAAPMLTQITSWLFRTLFFNLQPILKYVVKVVRWYIGIARKGPVGRLLLKRNLEAGSYQFDEEMSSMEEVVDFEMVSVGAFDKALRKYWTWEAADAMADSVSEMNEYFMSHPLGSNSYYHYTRGPDIHDLLPPEQFDIENHDFQSATSQHAALDDDPDSLESTYVREFDERTATLAEKQSHTAHPRVDRSEMHFVKNATHYEHSARPRGEYDQHGSLKHSMPHIHRLPKVNKHHLKGGKRLIDKPLHHDFDSWRLRCRSRFCGGHGAALEHPILAIRRMPNLDGHVFGYAHEDLDSHRKRFVVSHAVLHGFKTASHHVMNRHYWNGNGDLPRHASAVLKHLTGHSSSHDFIEHLMTRQEHPVDSLHSYVPVLSEWPPFKWMVEHNDNPETFYGNWMRDRIQFLNVNSTEDPLHSSVVRTATNGVGLSQRRRLMHVTLDTRAEIEAREASTGRKLFQFSGESAGRQSVSGPMRFVVADRVELLSDRILDPKTAVPSLPVFRLSGQTDCVNRPGSRQPRNPLCLPEIPQQVWCFVNSFYPYVYNVILANLNFCTYEPQCKDLGFQIIKRPQFSVDLIILVNNIDLFISVDWYINSIVWFTTLLSPILPGLKAILEVISTQAPFLFLVFDPLARLIPTTVVLNDFVCELIFIYAPVLSAVTLIILRMTLIPILQLIFRSIMSLQALITALIGINASLLARIETNEWWQVQNGNGRPATNPATLRQNNQYMVTPDGKRTVRDPAERLPSANELNNPFSASGRRNTIIGAELGGVDAGPTTDTYDPHANPDHVSTDAKRAMVLYGRCIERGLEYFGEPGEDDTLQEAALFERRMLPFMHTAHYTYNWFKRWRGEREHQRKTSKERRPTAMAYYAGSATHTL